MNNEIKNELLQIRKSIDNENVSYSELFFLQNHKPEILELNDIILAEWAGITENEWNNRELDLPF